MVSRCFSRHLKKLSSGGRCILEKTKMAFFDEPRWHFYKIQTKSAENSMHTFEHGMTFHLALAFIPGTDRVSSFYCTQSSHFDMRNNARGL